MNIIIIIAFLVIPILIGLGIRFFTKNKPKLELIIWAILMTIFLFFFAYGLILVISQETPLFTKNHRGNEFTVISTSIFLLLGYLYFKRNKNRLLIRGN